MRRRSGLLPGEYLEAPVAASAEHHSLDSPFLSKEQWYFQEVFR